MSQIIKDLSAGPVPPTVATSYNTQVGGPVVLTGNVLTISGDDSITNDNDGIYTDGSIANTVQVLLSNRTTAQVSTADATPTTIITLPLSLNTVYSVQGTVTLKAVATGDGGSYDFYGAFKRVGGGAVEIGTEYPTEFEDASLVTADFTISASGNNVILQVVGIAATNLTWDAILTYRQVS